MHVNGDTYIQWLEEDYPRPQLCRPRWISLNGRWGFCEDPKDCGIGERWYLPDVEYPHSIHVPYPPNSHLSGAVSSSDVVWYSRSCDMSELMSDSRGFDPARERLLLHFEGADYRCSVWVNGRFVGVHEGGYTAFSFDVTDFLDYPLNAGPLFLTVRSEDCQTDSAQPRGKQEWREIPHDIWYDRSQGLWRSVWMEVVPAVYIGAIDYRSKGASLDIIPTIYGVCPDERVNVAVTVSREGVRYAQQTQVVTPENAHIKVDLLFGNQFDEWDGYWRPDHPVLFDVNIELSSGVLVDHVVSYAGLREVAVDREYLLINNRPVYVKAVLDQGWWDESFFTPPNGKALEKDLRLVQRLGFNTVRVHQRSADKRYLTWADRLGILVWSEFPSSFVFSQVSMRRTLQQWSEQVRADSAHPSVVVWVPFNESWGVPHADEDEQQNFIRSIYYLTKALDPTRLVISNDGWEHVESDIVTTHDYADTGQELRVAYESIAAVKRTLEGAGPQGRKILVGGEWNSDKPVMVSEFGGISLAARSEESLSEESWGYMVSADKEEYKARLTELFAGLYASPVLAGICYTQFTDTRQETNGLCYADRSPKISEKEIARIVSGSSQAFTSQIRPRVISQVHVHSGIEDGGSSDGD